MFPYVLSLPKKKTTPPPSRPSVPQPDIFGGPEAQQTCTSEVAPPNQAVGEKDQVRKEVLGDLHTSFYQRLSPRSNPGRGGCINLAHHVRCSTLSQPSTTLFQHPALITTRQPLQCRLLSQLAQEYSTRYSRAGGYSAQCCYSRTRLLHLCQTLPAPQSPWGFLRVVRGPWDLGVAAVSCPISSALSGLYEHLDSRASPRFNRGIFQALCPPVGYRYSELMVCAKHQVGRVLRRVPLQASSRRTDKSLCTPALSRPVERVLESDS